MVKFMDIEKQDGGYRGWEERRMGSYLFIFFL